MKPEKGWTVEVISFIGQEFEDNNDKIGIVDHVDGDYIDVILNKSKVRVERSPNELKVLKKSGN